MTDRIIDPLDMAAQVAADQTNDRIAHYSRLAQPEQIQNKDGTWPNEECVECGSEIGEARLAHGKIRCVECQSALEKQVRFRR